METIAAPGLSLEKWMTTVYLLAADLVLILHALFTGFVVLGLGLVVIGKLLGWSWVRNLWLRTGHLLAIGAVAAEAWLGRDCPLTTWENSLREAGGGFAYPGTFIHHWLQKLIFYDFPPWVFSVAYTAFGILVLLAWKWIPPDVPCLRRHV